jgi:membrane-associated protease RseP (regulator of RpoE activity)
MTVEAQGNEGIAITNTEEGGIAARAGLKQGDRIISADNHPFKQARQFEAYLASHGGRPISIVIMRDGRQQTIMYTPPYRAGDSAWLGVFLEEGDSKTKGARITQAYGSDNRMRCASFGESSSQAGRGPSLSTAGRHDPKSVQRALWAIRQRGRMFRPEALRRQVGKIQGPGQFPAANGNIS